jgi:hypothetical protein
MDGVLFSENLPNRFDAIMLRCASQVFFTLNYY